MKRHLGPFELRAEVRTFNRDGSGNGMAAAALAELLSRMRSCEHIGEGAPYGLRVAGFERHSCFWRTRSYLRVRRPPDRRIDGH